MRKYLHGKNAEKERERELKEAEEKRNAMPWFNKLTPMEIKPQEKTDKDEYKTMKLYTRNEEDKICSLLNVHNVVWSAALGGTIHIWEDNLANTFFQTSLRNTQSEEDNEDKPGKGEDRDKKDRFTRRPEKEWICRYQASFMFSSAITSLPTFYKILQDSLWPKKVRK